MTAHSTIRSFAACLLVIGLAACMDDQTGLTDPAAETVAMAADGSAPPAPAGRVTVSFAGTDLEIWPWTSKDVVGTQEDPVNIIFVGDVDVVSLRAALMSLDGNRTAFGFPNAYPFNCTWKDAHGEMQTTYSAGDGWVANAVQLQCGKYEELRFHIRFFEAGGWVMAGTHFDLLIPNTAEHQVISWELAQQLLTVDFLRSGLLDPGAPFSAAAVSPPGPVKAILAPIYNGMPDPLKLAVGLPPGPTTSDVPIPNDGIATILNVGTRATIIPGVAESDFVMNYDQVVPRPFCSQGPGDYVLLKGPVYLTTSTRVNDQGMLESHNTLRGELEVTPINVTTGMPSGPTSRAQVSQIDNTGIGPNGTHVNAVLQRKALPPGVGTLSTHLVTGPNGMAKYTYSEKCN